MEIWDLNKLASLFRKRLEELEMKQKDLVDDTISAPTISNLATGRKKVKRETVIRLFEKVGISEEELPKLLGNEQSEVINDYSKLNLIFTSLEIDIDFLGPDIGLKNLRKLKLDTNNPYYFMYEYLIGKAYFYKEKWNKACDHFQKAIHLYDSNPKMSYTNIKSACLYDLGRIFYRENNISQALEYANTGLDLFCSDGERLLTKYGLLISKAIYLEKLERNDEALEILLDIYENDMDKIDTEIKLNLYQMLALLYNKKKMYPKAIHFAQIGIELGRLDKNYDRSFELLTTLASAFKNLGEIDKAKICFQTASRFEDKIRRKFLSVYNNLQLGLLYDKEGNLASAESALREAVTKGKEENDALLLFQALDALGNCLLKQNNDKEAIEQYEAAHKIAQKHSYLVQERDIVLKLALYYKNRDLAKYQKYSTRHFEVSVQLSQNGGDDMTLIEQIQSLISERKAAGDPPDR
jgi:tetratricopeptide (TPR) repeat protein